MKVLSIKLKLQYDETQHTQQAVTQSVQDILTAHEHNVAQCEHVLTCPQCDSDDIYNRHFDGTFRLPETYLFECNQCHHQWGHT